MSPTNQPANKLIKVKCVFLIYLQQHTLNNHICDEAFQRGFLLKV